jgi:hypothetical protein
MRDIFSKASKTLVWLGDGMPLDWRVIFWVRAKGLQKLDISTRRSGRAQLAMGEVGEMEQALMDFFRRPWFRRIWVVQEVAVSDEIEIHFGKLAITFGDLSYAIQIMLGQEVARFNFDWTAHLGLNAIAIMNWLHDHSKRNDPKRIKIEDILLRSARDFDATEPRDRIYALLGLPLDNRDLIPPVGYNIPTIALYKDVIKIFLESGKSFKCLAFGSSILPSWLPNLENLEHPRRLLLQCDMFKAGGDETYPISWTGSEEENLVLRGCPLDCVAEILPYEELEVEDAAIDYSSTNQNFD